MITTVTTTNTTTNTTTRSNMTAAATVTLSGRLLPRRVSSFTSLPSKTMTASEFSTDTNNSITSQSVGRLCPRMQEALPELKARFAKLSSPNSSNNSSGDADADAVFPILAPAITEQLQQRWKANEYERRAAVLIPLYSDNGVPSILLTARSAHVPQNPSEISFPGGHFQHDTDASLEDTALRETQEELLGNYPWRDPQHLVILGRGTTIPAINGTPVTPIIAVMMQELRPENDLQQSQSDGSSTHIQDAFPGDNSEVDHVFGMPLEQLLREEDSHELPNHRLLGSQRQGPRFPSPYGHIWGLTAFMLRPLLHNLYRPVFQFKK